MKFGFKASAEQFTARDLVEQAVHAEAVGMDSVLVSDHFQPWRVAGGHSPFSLAWLAAAGERTERIVLGTSVLAPHFRYNPAVIAQAFGTLAELNPGRLLLGVGTGEALNEVAAGWGGPTPPDETPESGVGSGHEWPRFPERIARLHEAITLIRSLWTGDRVSFEGSYFSTVGAALADVPEGGMPIYIAAGGPKAARLAGRLGDGFICTSGKGMELYRDRLLPALVEGAEEGGRHPEDIERMIEIKLSYHPDPTKALENTRFWAPLSLSPEQKHGLPGPLEIEAAADALPLAEVAKRWIVSSDPDEAVQAIAAYLDLGFTHLVVHAPGADQREFLDLFAADLLPRLRQLPIRKHMS